MISLFAAAQLLSCSDYDDLIEGLKGIDYYSNSDRLELMLIFKESTPSHCFDLRLKEGDAND